MREYNRREPLIVIHIPKAAGTSSKKFFRAWYNDGFYTHYYDERKGLMPTKRDLESMHTIDKPIVLHGHFNKLRRFGIEEYYPEANQFITILRDPFEMAISRYFYVNKSSVNWKDKSRVPKGGLVKYLRATKSTMLNHFPRDVTRENYKDLIEEYFIEIGITEYLETSMKWIAYKLGMRYDDSLLGCYNVTERDQEAPSYLKEQFLENNQLEYDLYNYVLQGFLERGDPP